MIVAGIGGYRFRKQNIANPSAYLMQLRVAAQGTCVGALSVGMAYNLGQKYIFHDIDHNQVSDVHELIGSSLREF